MVSIALENYHIMASSYVSEILSPAQFNATVVNWLRNAKEGGRVMTSLAIRSHLGPLGL